MVPDPTKIVAAPVNYLDHQAEMNEDAHIDALGVFLKAPSSVVAIGRDRPAALHRPALRPGGRARLRHRPHRPHVAAADALDYVAGYTCLLDITMRGGEDRSTRKSFDTFTPIGP